MSDKNEPKRRPLVLVAVMLFVAFAATAVWMYYPLILIPGPPLAFKIEGVISSKINFRDAGASINECAGTDLLPTSKIFRASGFFSGWSCEAVGNPDVIYSLNYSDAENRRYYCRGARGFPHGLNVGVFYQRDEISDIEFLSSWEKKPEQVQSVCLFLKHGIDDLKSGRKILIHCDAGRDRTGAVVALMAAFELEERGALTDNMINAIECDYQKSKSLRPEKYGRIAAILKMMRDQGGVRKFIQRHCGALFSGI